ncbi:TPA: hypothetical protein DEP90_01230 [Patescibacteria group bacterium]|nr:hypothetical protein [Patescibacteria group bacterium]
MTKPIVLKIIILSILLSCVVVLTNDLGSTSVYAANVLSNPSFTGGTTGWTLSGDANYYSLLYEDSAGSVGVNVLGRKQTVTGTIQQTISTSIVAGSAVDLSFYHRRHCDKDPDKPGDETCEDNEIYVRMIYSGSTYYEWYDASTVGNDWTYESVDISSYITSTGTYTFEIYLNVKSDNDADAAASANLDNINLDVIPPNITTSTTGTQISTVSADTADFYVGGAFTFVRNTGSTTVTSITISETGTIADTDISGLILYYKQEATCSTSIPGDATQFNATPGSFSSGSSTVTGSMSVGTSQVCMYVEVDIGSGASVDETVLIQITNPSTQVTASAGTVSPATAVAISETTTIVVAVSISITSDGVVSFGTQDLNTTADTTSGDLNDIETVSVDSGPVDLDVRSSTFTDGGNTWTYASTNGANQIKFEFSKDGSAWTTILLADTLYVFDTNVAQSATRDLYLRLTTPTTTDSYSQYSTTVTIVASIP